jgi:hypothetical protein
MGGVKSTAAAGPPEAESYTPDESIIAELDPA